MIVDARRGITEGDLALLEWAGPAQRAHVLLSKTDKLSRNDARRALIAAAAAAGERVSVQLFSAHTHAGIEEAYRVLSVWLGDAEK